MSSEMTGDPDSVARPVVPVVPGSLLLLLLVVVGMAFRCWAWAEVSIRFWLFHFVLTASGDVLGPQLHFTNLYYTFPYTVTLESPSLSEDSETFLSADQLRLTLQELPAAGKPIHVREVKFFEPELRFEWREDGTMVGINEHFIKSIEGEQYSDSISTRPSDFLSIRILDVDEGTLVFEPLDSDPIKIDDIEFTLDAAPEQDRPGLYRLEFGLDLKPALVVDMDGAIDIDTGRLEIEKFIAIMDIERGRMEGMPPDIMEIIEEHEIHGDITLKSNGIVPVADPAAASLDIELLIEGGAARIGDYLIPVSRLDAHMEIVEKAVDLEVMDVTFHESGQMTMSGHLDLQPPRAFDVIFDMEDVYLSALLERFDVDAPGYNGYLGAQGRIASQADEVLEHLEGNSVVTLVDGDILNVPIIDGLREAVLGVEPVPDGNDHGSMLVVFRPDRLELDDVSLEGEDLGVRGNGEIYYDGSLNLRFNAGPLEKFQMETGVIGDILGMITDRLVTYQVTGTWEDPRFNGRLLNVGTKGRRKGSGS